MRLDMRRAGGYLRTLRQYVRSVKGRRDVLDYAVAGVSFVLVTLIAWILLSAVR